MYASGNVLNLSLLLETVLFKKISIFFPKFVRTGDLYLFILVLTSLYIVDTQYPKSLRA